MTKYDDHVVNLLNPLLPENPDNRLGNESYAIMDVTKAGRWLDVGQDEAYPFVCARYTAQCPSVATFFNNSAGTNQNSLFRSRD